MNYDVAISRAQLFAERYGICDYTIRGSKMIYYVSYPAYLRQPRYTVKHTVNLVTMQETTEELKRYNPRGEVNR